MATEVEYPDLGFDSPAEDSLEFYTGGDNVARFEIEKTITKDGSGVSTSRSFVSSPPVVHFGGIVIGKEYTQTIYVYNRSPKISRFMVIHPTSSAFKLSFEKRNVLAAGMCQEIVVKFKPTEITYYYDCIRVNGEEQDVVIPLHGYPVVNTSDFPKTLRFGNIPLCEPVTKVKFKQLRIMLGL
jgi:hypothetical protein